VAPPAATTAVPAALVRVRRRCCDNSWAPVAGRARRWNSAAVAASLACLGAIDIAASNRGAQEAATKRSIWDGVYTDLQADRGEREYGRGCEHCHGAGLEGDGAREIPPLVSDPFMRNWNGKNLRELFELLSRSMPADNRGSLSVRTYVDLVAHLLKANEVPGGTSALPDAPAALASIVIERPAR
jgi:S-disulfanyl-L-cysteine oxidoreductase SoxD